MTSATLPLRLIAGLPTAHLAIDEFAPTSRHTLRWTDEDLEERLEALWQNELPTSLKW